MQAIVTRQMFEEMLSHEARLVLCQSDITEVYAELKRSYESLVVSVILMGLDHDSPDFALIEELGDSIKLNLPINTVSVLRLLQLKEKLTSYQLSSFTKGITHLNRFANQMIISRIKI